MEKKKQRRSREDTIPGNSGGQVDGNGPMEIHGHREAKETAAGVAVNR